MTKLHYLAAVVLATTTLFVASFLLYGNQYRYGTQSTVVPVGEQYSDASVLAERTIVNSEYTRSGEVKYGYLGDLVPEKLVPGEVVKLRTENSYTREVDRFKEGEREMVKMEGVFYAKPVFAQDADGSWKYLEYATTTETAWLNRPQPFWYKVASTIIRVAYAVTATIYSTVGDGYIAGFGSTFSICDGTAWSVARDDTTGGASYVSTAAIVSSSQSEDLELSACFATINRMFLPFDTSSISPSATISAASLNVYVYATTDEDNDSQGYVTVIRTAQATHTSLSNTDYNDVGSTEGIDSGQRKDITSITINAYLSFTLNATGLGWIAKSGDSSNCSGTAGVSCFGLREGHDFTGASINVNTANQVDVYTSEQTGTSFDPYLSVTYTAPDSFAFWMFQDF